MCSTKSPHSITWVDIIYEQFEQIFKSKWTQELPTQGFEKATKSQWLVARRLQGITPRELIATIDFYRDGAIWPPSIHEFANKLDEVKLQLTREAERERLGNTPRLAQPDDIRLMTDEGTRVAKRIKEQNPDFTWKDVQKAMSKYWREKICIKV